MTIEMTDQRPDRAVRRERLAVQQAEVRWHFFVAAHGVGHAGAGVDAGEVVPISARNTVKASPA